MPQLKIFIPICLFFVATMLHAQTQNIHIKSGLTDAEKATVALSAVYDFSGEQALAVKQIETAKFKNLADVASLKTTNITDFNQKRAAIAGIADSEIRDVLDARQRILFDKNAAAKLQKINVMIAAWQKQKISETGINEKLAAAAPDEF